MGSGLGFTVYGSGLECYSQDYEVRVRVRVRTSGEEITHLRYTVMDASEAFMVDSNVFSIHEFCCS